VASERLSAAGIAEAWVRYGATSSFWTHGSAPVRTRIPARVRRGTAGDRDGVWGGARLTLEPHVESKRGRHPPQVDPFVEKPLVDTYDSLDVLISNLATNRETGSG